MQIDDIESAINDNEVITELEHVMSEWCAALAEVMAREAEKHPVGSGPLAGMLGCTCLCTCTASIIRHSRMLSLLFKTEHILSNVPQMLACIICLHDLCSQ